MSLCMTHIEISSVPSCLGLRISSARALTRLGVLRRGIPLGALPSWSASGVVRSHWQLHCSSVVSFVCGAVAFAFGPARWIESALRICVPWRRCVATAMSIRRMEAMLCIMLSLIQLKFTSWYAMDHFGCGTVASPVGHARVLPVR
jgi:hypothetical protein